MRGLDARRFHHSEARIMKPADEARDRGCMTPPGDVLRGEPLYRIPRQARSFYGLGTQDHRGDAGAAAWIPKSWSICVLDLRSRAGRTRSARYSRPRHRHRRNLPGAAVATAECARHPGRILAQDALETAAENARLNGLAGRFATVQSNWFENLSGRYRCNRLEPALYQESGVIPSLDREVRDHDPLAGARWRRGRATCL